MKSSSSHYDVVILGAGAAGLLCAFTAADRGRRVLVLERANKVGKKILMSGGGRCNFTNLYVEAENFISDNPHFCKAALSRYTQWNFIALTQEHGIEYEERRHGQLFCKGSAKEIVAMLLAECRRAGVDIQTRCEVDKVTAIPQVEITEPSTEQPPDRYRIAWRHGESDQVAHCRSVVVATGALSIPTLGGSGLGYDIARQFGLPVTERRAGLVPFTFSDGIIKPLCQRLSGVTLEVTASCNGRSFTENLLFTHRGLSGPAMLQISNYWRPGDEIVVDLLPAIEAADWLLTAKRERGKSLLRTVLGRELPRGLAAELEALWWPASADRALAELSDKVLNEIGERLNGWHLKPAGTEGYRTAEVTLGGVATDAISSRTMAVKHQPGLYFVGEVLDVTGHLGGFNFQWAWSSGYSAGLAV